ncbi:hypothetical protein ACLMJK_005706 [Lecanora helva]
MNQTLSSPLKSIQGAAIQDRRYVVFSPRPVQTSWQPPHPQRRNSEWISVPKGSLNPPHNGSVLRHVLIPSKPSYKPNVTTSHTLPQQKQQVSVTNYNEKWRKVIISRQLLVNGHTVFVIGQKFGGITTREAEEVPLSRILDHVTPAELHRYENQEFLLEDLREENLPPAKPRGRPPKIPAVNARLPRAETDSPTRALPRLARVANNVSVVVPGLSPKQQQLAVRNVARLQRVAVPIRSPIKPSPLNPTTLASHHKQSTRPQYSMVAASGLAPSETSLDETSDDPISRAESQDPLSLEERFPKRRKVLPNPANGVPETPSRSPTTDTVARPAIESTPRPRGPNQEERRNSSSDQKDSPLQKKPPIATIDDRDSEEEREALLRQFQPYNPPPIPPSALNPPSSSPPPQPLNLTPQPHPTTAPTTQTTTPRTTRHTRTSLTPHFPLAARLHPTPTPKPQSSPSKTQNLAFRSPTKRKLSPELQLPSTTAGNSGSQQSSSSRSSRPEPEYTRGERGLGRVAPPPRADITAYFRPKTTSTANVSSTQHPSAQPTTSSDSESESESEDPLTRASPSSDSSSKEVEGEEKEDENARAELLARMQGRDGRQGRQSEVRDSQDERATTRGMGFGLLGMRRG